MKIKQTLLGSTSILLMVLVLGAQPGLGQVPRTISYQGLLIKPDGTPENGNIEMILKLYESDTGGTVLWSDTVKPAVSDGVFNVILGNPKALNYETGLPKAGQPLPFDKPYWLEVSVGTQLLKQRVQLMATPYSLNAQQVAGTNIFPANGNVGIGETNPAARLHVNTPGLGDNGVGFRMGGEGKFVIDAPGVIGGRVTVLGNGNVGIGTTSPGTKLEIESSTAETGEPQLRIENPTAEVGQFAGVRFRTASGWDVRLGTVQDKHWLALTGSDGGYQHTWREIEYHPGNADAFITGSGSNIAIMGGNVGIGTPNPTQAKLVVQGGVQTGSKTYGYLNSEGKTGIAADDQPYSISCSDRILASEFDALSDRRTKNLIGKSDSHKDLETLNKLQVTDYAFIDVVGKGNRPQKKLIAQQVQEIYPLAVSATTDFIPNVYELSVSTVYDAEHKRLNITTAKAHSLVVGDTVRLIDEAGERKVEVLAVADEHTFTVESEKALEKVFVYGVQVDDFLALDYDAIAMLNVSATQELAKRVDAQQSRIQELESENVALKERLARIELALQKLEVLPAFQKVGGAIEVKKDKTLASFPK
ncbi:tail fiber domain-containing protein [Candidatus Poribacteria bacterium]|nr:tail fiber domain-containing protein [Candidatus Poribacteria bacterium]